MNLNHKLGTCSNGECICKQSEVDGYNLFTGTHCQFSRPCPRLLGGQGDIWRMNLRDPDNAWKSYGRAVYDYHGGSNKTVPENDNLALVYTGSRWFFTVFEGAQNKSIDYWLEYSKEMHAFWDRIYKGNTQAVSNPTTRSDPIAVDFFRIGRRGEKYGPLGELIPLQEPPGAGYFECSLNSTIGELVEDILGEQ